MAMLSREVPRQTGPADAGARLGETTYQIADEPIPEDEAWSFQPGDIIVVEQRPDGLSLVAVARAMDFDERSWVSRRMAS